MPHHNGRGAQTHAGAMSYRLEAAGMCMIGRRQQAGRHLGRYVMQGEKSGK